MKRLLQVGIMSAPTLRFALHGNYTFAGKTYTGEQTAVCQNSQVLFHGNLYKSLNFTGGDSFTLREVTIGVNFHWQRQEDQTFTGDLCILSGQDKVLYPDVGLIAINQIDVEDYLASVISSEMAATSSLELLKVHAVISRSWLLHPLLSPQSSAVQVSYPIIESNRVIRIYERDAHRLFDVCADDHCQRYQGITRQTSPNVQAAIDATCGEVLTYNGEVCDARFYKCCGGRTEVFETCWAETPHPYIESVEDSFCDTSDRRILQQVLNDYDLQTRHFHDWEVRYTQAELSELIHHKSGIDFGEILSLTPLKRGASGRIYELEVVGTKRRMIVGKELEIRRWLSPTHLYSSAFTIDTITDGSGISFLLCGKGWGHGVGLCQIGAAVMADKGYDYQQILAHYFPKATLNRLQ